MNHFKRLLTVLQFTLCTVAVFAEGNGCSLSVIVDSTHASAPQAQDGSVSAIVTGGTAPYTYQWYTGETSQTRTNLGTGRYCVTVTDANGCTGSDCSRVSAPGCESYGIGIGMIDSGGLGNNTVFAWASGGTAPYNYTWSTGASTDTLYNVPDGGYRVTVTDASACSMTGSVGNINMVGINETALTEAEVYPNPVRDVLHIDLPNSKDVKLQLLSVEGKVVLVQSLVQGNNTIPTNGLAKGMYVCRINNKEGTAHSNRKILIE
ncbi:MAG: T9SS type A sorting domain-containing protein [Bacteroidetes bacterium]|nr:T9SS type A sorting domain-containing protein [Bacteroidota bacterium]